MKTRLGFVSNSSSSSFVCDICGRTEVIYDGDDYREYEFVNCENGHTICDEEVIKTDDQSIDELMLSADIDEEDESRYDDDYLKEAYCPICQFEISSKPDIKRYLAEAYKITEEEVFAEVKKLNARRKKLYDNEYVNYVYNKFNLQESTLLKELKEKFKTYSEFLKSLKL